MKELDDYYQKIKASEWHQEKTMPSENLPGLAARMDRAYLLYSLRLYCRLLCFSTWSRKENVKISEEDFAGMHLILARRANELAGFRLLEAYSITAKILKLDPANEATPRKIDDHLIYLLTFRNEIPVEDYADIVSYVSSYCRVARNKNQGKPYPALAFQAQLQMVDGKYGAGWNKNVNRLSRLQFTNLAVSALDNAEHFDWANVPMDFIASASKDRTVYEWVEAFIDKYKSRLSIKERKEAVIYVRIQSAFYRKNFIEAGNTLLKMGEAPLEVFGLSLRRLQLIIYYELQFCTGDVPHKLARKIEKDPAATIKKMRAHIKDLKDRQNRLTYQGLHFTTFIDAYADLLRLRKEAEKWLPGSMERTKWLYTSRGPTLQALEDYQHPSGEWLRRQLSVLQ